MWDGAVARLIARTPTRIRKMAAATRVSERPPPISRVLAPRGAMGY